MFFFLFVCRMGKNGTTACIQKSANEMHVKVENEKKKIMDKVVVRIKMDVIGTKYI